jgi:hypothetical protein
MKITGQVAVGVLSLLVGLALGALGSREISGTLGLFRGNENVSCLDRGVCVGAAFPAALRGLNEDRYGLTAYFCYEHGPLATDYIFMSDIIAGRRCRSPNFEIEFRNFDQRTLVKIEDGKIVSIKKGPLHTLDF